MCELEFLQCELTLANEQSPAVYYHKSAVDVSRHKSLFHSCLWHICVHATTTVSE